MGPGVGLHPAPGVIFQPGNFRCLGQRKTADGRQQIARAHFIAAISAHYPLVRCLVESAVHDPGIEGIVPAQVEAVGNVIGILENLGLGGEALTPLPLGQQFGRERIGIVEALHIAARAGIAVPEPGAADVRCGLEAEGCEPHFAEFIVRIEPGKAGTDHRNIDCGGHIAPCFGLIIHDHLHSQSRGNCRPAPRTTSSNCLPFPTGSRNELRSRSSAALLP